MLRGINDFVDGTTGIAVKISGLLMTIAFIAFLFAIINYIWKRSKGEAGGLKQAGNMLYGSVFALFVMVAVWGIVFFLSQNSGIAIGGCSPKPSSIPGQPVVDNCIPGVANRAVAGTRTLPAPSSTTRPPTNGGAGTGSTGGSGAITCTNGVAVRAANGDIISCNQGGVQPAGNSGSSIGEACTFGTCASGYRCDIPDATYSPYGTCVRN
jgi:hypothetical protein